MELKEILFPAIVVKLSLLDLDTYLECYLKTIKNKYIAEHFVFKLTSFFRKHILNPKILLLFIRMCYSVAKYKAKIHFIIICVCMDLPVLFLLLFYRNKKNLIYKVTLIQVNDC